MAISRTDRFTAGNQAQRDAFLSPFRGADGKVALIHAVEVQATAFLNLARGDVLVAPSLATQLALCGLAGCVAGFAFYFTRSWLGVVAAGLLATGTVMTAWLLYRHANIWFPWLIPLFQVAFSLGWFLFTWRFAQLWIEKRAEGTLVGYLFHFRAAAKPRE